MRRVTTICSKQLDCDRTLSGKHNLLLCLSLQQIASAVSPSANSDILDCKDEEVSGISSLSDDAQRTYSLGANADVGNVSGAHINPPIVANISSPLQSDDSQVGAAGINQGESQNIVEFSDDFFKALRLRLFNYLDASFALGKMVGEKTASARLNVAPSQVEPDGNIGWMTSILHMLLYNSVLNYLFRIMSLVSMGYIVYALLITVTRKLYAISANAARRYRQRRVLSAGSL